MPIMTPPCLGAILSARRELHTHRSHRNSEKTVPMAPLMRMNIHCSSPGHSKTSSLAVSSTRKPGHSSTIQNIPTKPGHMGWTVKA